MKLFQPRRPRRLTWPMVLALLVAPLSHAAVSACASGPTGSAVNSFGATAAGNGCASVDLSFENLGVSTTTNTGTAYTSPTTANTNIFTTTTAFTGNAITPITLTYVPGTGGDWTGTSGGNSQLVATFTGSVTANSSGSYTGGTYTQPLSGYVWVFDTLALSASGTVSNTAGSSIAISQTICMNTTTFSAGCAQRAVLTANFAQNSSTATLGCTIAAGTLGSCTGSTLDLSNGVNVTTLAYSTSVTLNRAASATVTLNSFGDTFTQTAVTPEPSTFGLLGSALFGIAALRRSRNGN